MKQVLLIAAVLGIFLTGLSIFGATPAHAQSPQQTVASCKKDFFGLEPWYQYLGVEMVPNGSSSPPYDSCDFKCFNIFTPGPGVGQPQNACGQNTGSDIPLILLAVVDDLLRIAALTAVAFVIYGAFEYVGSQGNSEVTAKAQSMIVNALIGLAIAMIAVVVVNFIGNNLGT
jgi:hypothetical protein